MNLIIKRPTENELNEIHQLFSTTVRNTFKEEGIETETNTDIELLKKSLKSDFATNGNDEYYLIAKYKNKIVGTIAYGIPNQHIRENLEMDISGIPEIKSVYILPDFQRKGIGTLLFKEILMALRKAGVKSFCLDCGYKKAQQFWKRKLGNPICVMNHYWGDGEHHMIWYQSVFIL